MPISITKKIGEKNESLTLSLLKYYFVMDLMAGRLVRIAMNEEALNRAALKVGAKV